MEMPFGLYPQFYVKRKAQLFPLIEKYSGKKISSGTPHGEILPLYLRLLKTDASFKADVDALIAGQESKLMTVQQKADLQKEVKANKGAPVESNLHGGAEFKNAGGIFSTIINTVGGVITGAQAKATAQAESDEAFYEVVLNAQKKDDTTKILVISGAAIVIVGLAIFLIVKMKKKG